MARRRSRVVRLLRSRAISRGVFGGSTGWRVLAGMFFGRKIWRKVMGVEPEIVAVEKLKPGQFISVETINPKSVRSRPGTSKRRS